MVVLQHGRSLSVEQSAKANKLRQTKLFNTFPRVVIIFYVYSTLKNLGIEEVNIKQALLISD